MEVEVYIDKWRKRRKEERDNDDKWLIARKNIGNKVNRPKSRALINEAL